MVLSVAMGQLWQYWFLYVSCIPSVELHHKQIEQQVAGQTERGILTLVSQQGNAAGGKEGRVKLSD